MPSTGPGTIWPPVPASACASNPCSSRSGEPYSPAKSRPFRNREGVLVYINLHALTSRAVDLPLSHQLSHDTKNPGGWENFSVYCRFLNEEFGRFVARLKDTPEPGGDGAAVMLTIDA